MKVRKKEFSLGKGNSLKVFLGGTCNSDTWRDRLIPMLDIDYFNPVVDDWTEQDRINEIEERKTCDIILYVITPSMKGFYSIAEVVDDSNKRPEKTIFTILGYEEFEDFQKKSLFAISDMVGSNGVEVFENLRDTAEYINNLR